MSTKKILIGVGCVGAFILSVMIIALLTKSGITVVINKQLTALRSGDIATAYSYTSTDFRHATSLKDFEDFVNHYASLKDNKRASLPDREVTNDTGVVRGTLYSNDGVATPVEYLLVREDGSWRILGIQINPEGISASDVSDNTNPTIKTYDNQDSRYTMQYPSNWEYEKAGDGTVIFSGKRGSPSYFSTVNVQTVLTRKTGGDFSTVKQFMADIKSQALTQSPGVKFLESGPIEIKEKNGAKDKGEFTIFIYKYKGKEFKQWQVVVLRNDGQVFYAWAYTTPVDQYPNDLPVAQQMLKSWVIY